jgi:membrane associated rhomboid family serine protease
MNRPVGRAPVRREAPRPATVLLGTVSLMWLVEGIDQMVLDQGLDRHGIVPREVDGLTGILFAPFLHAGFGHLMANTLPLVLLGALIAFKGVVRLLTVTVGVILVGGLGVWLFGRDGVHLGASLLVFGYFGYLLAAAVFERRLRSVVLAVIAALLYGGLIWGVVPTTDPVSWEGHLAGLLAGVFMAWFVTRDRTGSTTR